jgi:hypothetical protein
MIVDRTARVQGPAPGLGRYRIEYLTWSEVDAVVCSVEYCGSSLASAVLQARIGSTNARIRHRANGFRICDGRQSERVVADERFWGFDGGAGLGQR